MPYHRALAVFAVRVHLLHEPDAQRPLRAELAAEEQMVHRIAPAGAGQVAEMRANRRRNSALRFELTESAVSAAMTMSPASIISIPIV